MLCSTDAALSESGGQKIGVPTVYVRGSTLYSVTQDQDKRPKQLQLKNGDALSAQSVGGIGDFDGDGSSEIVYADDNAEVRYAGLNSGGNLQDDGTGLVLSSANSVGRLADYDDDGTLELPYYDGTDSGIDLADSNGQDQSYNPSTNAVQAPMGAFDYTGESTQEIIYIGADNGYIRYMNPDNGNSGIVKSEQVSNNVGVS